MPSYQPDFDQKPNKIIEHLSALYGPNEEVHEHDKDRKCLTEQYIV